MDKTKDLRDKKELVFVSFKKNFNKDISPSTISSWIKQTVILCYQLSDQEFLALHQVKAHDLRAFTASKAFQGGFSLEQILSACHWKSHNTFTQFYLKDVAWADLEFVPSGSQMSRRKREGGPNRFTGSPGGCPTPVIEVIFPFKSYLPGPSVSYPPPLGSYSSGSLLGKKY